MRENEIVSNFAKFDIELPNGEGDINSIDLSDSILKEDKTLIEDLIKAAHSNAKSQLKSKTSEEIAKATGGLGIADFKWPL